MKRMLVTGGSGLLGSTVALQGANQYDILTTYLNRPIDFQGIDCRRVNLAEDRQMASLKRFDPDAVIHCAALTDVDKCERNPQLAETLNTEMTERVARFAEDTNARLIHLSTDAVFDGSGRNYTICDPPNPINVYGKTKLEAESVVQKTHRNSVVVRTNMYGWNATDGESLAEWMLGKLRNNEPVNAFMDAYFTPIYTGDLATCLFELVESDITGTLHVAGTGRCSKLEFAREICDVFELDHKLIVPASIDDMDFDAPRGKDLSLSTERTQEQLGRSLPTLREGLAHMRRDENG